MSYKALYRKYRPTNFNEIKGQEHITSILNNIIKDNKVSHAYLFAGPRGTGKTSAAKVFANVLNCKNLVDGINPCKTCEFCKSTNNGQSLDVLEIDAASNNGVAEIRELRENVKYAPSISKYKVYIIDEVHMLTKGAFNALLKTLEEPPKHAIFILATTEPHKIPVTIISRTQRFNFRRVANHVVFSHLESVLNNEKIEFEKTAINTIAKLSNGGMRDALSILDQVSAFTNGKITFQSVSQVFGIISKENLIILLNHAAQSSVEKLLQLTNDFIDGGADIQRTAISLIEILKDFIVFKITNNNSKLLKTLSPEEVTTLILSTNQAYKMLDTLVELLTQLHRSEYPRQTFELAILHLIDREQTNEEILVTTPTKTIIPEVAKEEIAEIEGVDELFTTQELMNPTTIEPTSEEIENTTEILTDSLESEANSEEATNEITTVRDVNEVEPVEVHQEIEETDDLLSLFKTNDEEMIPVNIAKHSTAEIINLLVQTDSEKLLEAKRLMPTVLSHSTNNQFAKFVSLIDECKLISAGQNFILISSNNESIIKEITNSYEDPGLLGLVSTVFGGATRLFAINKTEFLNVKERYAILAQSNNLPNPEPIKPMEEIKQEKTEAEQLGDDLFGDLFSM